MNTVVCVKRIPMTQEVDLEIENSGKGIKKDALAYIVNEWDNYAIEEAILLKEKYGGSVTAVTAGTEDDEEVLRRALAMGADKALRIDSGELELDGFVTSKIISAAIRDMDYDLILTGVQADDDNAGMVGIMLAENLSLPHASVVTGVENLGGTLKINVELEDGMEEISVIRLPALLTIQTGINEPRYVSIMGIRKARNKELNVIKVSDLDIDEEDLRVRNIVEEVYLPPETEVAEIIKGDASTVAGEIIRIIKEKGVNI